MIGSSFSFFFKSLLLATIPLSVVFLPRAIYSSGLYRIKFLKKEKETPFPAIIAPGPTTTAPATCSGAKKKKKEKKTGARHRNGKRRVLLR